MANHDNFLSKIEDIRGFLIEWNNTYPFDRIYRKKYNIPFGSEEHLSINQIDVYLDIAEDRLFNNLFVDLSEVDSGRKKYKHGEIYREEKESEEVISELFDKIDINDIQDNGGQ